MVKTDKSLQNLFKIRSSDLNDLRILQKSSNGCSLLFSDQTADLENVEGHYMSKLAKCTPNEKRYY